MNCRLLQHLLIEYLVRIKPPLVSVPSIEIGLCISNSTAGSILVDNPSPGNYIDTLANSESKSSDIS